VCVRSRHTTRRCVEASLVLGDVIVYSAAIRLDDYNTSQKTPQLGRWEALD
jgi:hypothetical protein